MRLKNIESVDLDQGFNLFFDSLATVRRAAPNAVPTPELDLRMYA